MQCMYESDDSVNVSSEDDGVASDVGVGNLDGYAEEEWKELVGEDPASSIAVNTFQEYEKIMKVLLHVLQMWMKLTIQIV